MGFEKSHLFGKVEVDITATAPGTIVFQTETPGGSLVQRFSMPIKATTRTVLRSRLPGTMQGHYVRATGTPPNPGQWEVYGVRVWCRELPDGQWTWHPLPVMDTPLEFIRYTILEDPTEGAAGGASVGFSEFKVPVEPTPDLHRELRIPVEATPESFSELKLPVEPTGETFSELKVPVEPTGETFGEMKMPVEPTSETFTSMQIPMAATPAEFAEMKMPVEGTPDSYSEFKMPVKETPPVPIWQEVEVDA